MPGTLTACTANVAECLIPRVDRPSQVPFTELPAQCAIDYSGLQITTNELEECVLHRLLCILYVIISIMKYRSLDSKTVKDMSGEMDKHAMHMNVDEDNGLIKVHKEGKNFYVCTSWRCKWWVHVHIPCENSEKHAISFDTPRTCRGIKRTPCTYCWPITRVSRDGSPLNLRHPRVNQVDIYSENFKSMSHVIKGNCSPSENTYFF